MRARQTLIETFSSFIQFEDDRFRTWLSDPRLKRSLTRRAETAGSALTLEADSESHSERQWMRHWHAQWQKHPQGLGRDHLLAYLQEACYWVAYKASTRFTSTQFGTADCFQLAIAQLEKVLTGFDPAQGYDLKNYASTTFRSLIRDYLRQRKEVDICTDWSLLRKVSQTRLTKALQTQGRKDEIEKYVLAWQGYQLLYAPTKQAGSRQLTPPGPDTWSAIAQHYNSEKHALTSKPPTATDKDIETWMLTAAKAVRSFLYPSAVSMNATLPGQDTGEFIDSFTDEDTDTPLASLITEETQTQRQQQYSQLTHVLQAAVSQLKPDAQKLLPLYYSGDLTQKQIADQLGIKQYSISRQLSRIRKALLLALAQWTETTLHISPSPDLLKHTSAALDEWLHTHYKHDDAH
ncbi:MAG: sigma-70 family RNA polymerase sigma factor [Cyanobacteria bacterium J06598_3]